MLQLTGVSKSYGGQPGVTGADLVAPRGSRTVIVGPSGSGKTTLLRLIAGFEMPDAGSITLDGRSLTAVPPHRRNIAYVTQEGALFPHMSVADNIGFAMTRNAPDRAARIDDLLARVGLPAAMRQRRPHELSGGQQQRVALARALAQRPDLMLLDEPFSALDTSLREAMRTMVGDVLREAGIISILVTHDRAEALAFADHLVVMRAGSVADAGPPQRLYDQPADAETAAFLGEAIVVSGDISGGVASTALGPIPVRHADMRDARILLRPEQLEIAAGAGVTGRVLHRTYQGAHWRLELACEGVGQNITMDVPTGSDLQDAVRLSVSGTGHVLG